MRRRSTALVALFLSLAVPRSAWAALDPGRAQNDVQEAMTEKAYTFCSAPHEPLSPRAISLCPSARDTPRCEGFAAACARAGEAREPREPRHLPGLSGPWRAMGAILRTLAQLFVWLLVAALLAAVLIPIARALTRLRREERPTAVPREAAKADDAAPEDPAISDEEALLARAADLAARGENGAALELYLAASLRALDKRGAVRLAAHRTNGEYVRSCAELAAKTALSDIVREVDRVKFGGARAQDDVIRRAAQRAFAIVRTLPIAMLALAALLSMGCGSAAPGPRRPGDDPAGLELFQEVLHRQGVRVEPLGSSLASMPLPSRDGSTASPAVVVDVERTPLDDDTGAHLVDWVDAGGVLVLAGSPRSWPDAFGAASIGSGASKVTARTLLGRASDDDEDEVSSQAGAPVYAAAEEHGELAASGEGFEFRGAAERAAWLSDDATYAAVLAHGHGLVLGIATDELLTNAGLARRGNAAAMIAMLSNCRRLSFSIADPDDGLSPPSTPLASMLRAGLGTGLAHALVASIVLFLAAGSRLARPRPAAPLLRRAFVEHVEAVGALYARTGNAAHALAAYARFADERLRARLPRQTTDVAAFLSSRARVPLERCQRLWARATAARAGALPQGDELAILGELATVYSAATAQDT